METIHLPRTKIRPNSNRANCLQGKNVVVKVLVINFLEIKG
jgi:hypothetical protein